MKTFEEEWRARFERFGRTYERDDLVSGWSEKGLWTRFERFADLLQTQTLLCPLRVLDLGCGAGTYVRYLANGGHKVVGLDYSIPTLHRALTADSERHSPYLCGEAYHLPFKDESFDLVTSVGVIQALGSPERALDEMVRVLRPNGLLIVEALNSLELLALGRSLYDWALGRSPRLHTHSSSMITSLLSARGVRLIKKAGIYLPPRGGVPWLAPLFSERIIRVIGLVPGLSVVLAHAFLYLSLKESND